MALTDKLIAIANAIRAKTGGTDQMTLDQMATAISGISGGVEEPYIKETYDTNGNLTSVELVGYSRIRDNAFYSCSNLTLTSLPSSVIAIGAYAFYNCSNLALTSLPNTVTTIKNRAFYNCYNLVLTSLPSSVTTIGSYAFQYCTGLVSLTFKGVPNSVDSNVFSNCANLTTINVPWAEGAVANAPWGATNATINYNYTEV